MIQLSVISGTNKGATFRAEEPSFIIGRGRTSRIILVDNKVSARHAQVECRDRQYVLRDLDSTNGTYVNGRAVTEAVLHRGDEIRLGQTVLKVTHLSVGPAPAPARVSLSDAPAVRPAPVHARVRRESPPPVLQQPPEDSSQPTLAEAYRNLLAMYEVSRILQSRAEIDKMLEGVLDQVFRNFRAERGAILLFNDETGELEPRVFRSRSDGPGADEMTLSRTIVQQVVDRQEAILTTDATLDERFGPAESIVQQHIRSAMCAPLSTRHRALGILYVDCRTEAGTFKKADLELLTAIGNEAGIAVENQVLREANIKAERLAAIGQAVADLSHYIKNVLTCMEAGSEIVEAALADQDPDAVRKGWDIVRRNERKMSELVLDMLNYSAERTPIKVPCTLNDVVEDVVESARPAAAAVNACIVLELDPDPPAVPADPNGLHRCVLNLIANALDAVEGVDHATVTVTTGHEAEHAFLRVSDNGPGIPEDVMPKIFDVFVSTKGEKGTGLGLAVVKKIVHEHAGEVSASNAPDGGAVFQVLLPLRPPEPLDANAP